MGRATSTPSVEQRLHARVRIASVLGLALLLALWFLMGHPGVGQGAVQPSGLPQAAIRQNATEQTATGQGRSPLSICPVAHGVVKDNFGAPRAGHTHQGDDILAAYGTPVLATFDGRVHDSQTVGGKIVKLVAPDGSFTVGKHLSATTGPGRVKTGDVIGYVGRLHVPGDLPHLHFEWHPGGGPAVNPFPYLSQVCPNTQPPG